MKRLPALLAVALVFIPAAAPAGQADVVIQAGHQGRPASCAPLHVRACNLGAAAGGVSERAWTPIVADAAARALRADGFTVIRRPADYAGHDVARVALFLHFDGDVTPCGSGASVGFPSGDAAFARAWERDYRAWFPFRFRGENISAGEREYYGYRKVTAPDKLLIEFGEISCPVQRTWLAPRLEALGERVAAFVDAELRR